ncbi:MAG TPA: DUF1440 domain-containing protein [Pyrinomonadaceae bacterium]|nr:DUF1440 domain-containing protein [Pyrinomonadaceae bacterium]
MNKYLAGALAGTLATIPMTLTMVALHRLIPKKERKPLPPKQITMEIAEDVGVSEVLDEEIEQDTVSFINHFAYGAATGAAYAAVAEKVDFPPAALGVGYGLAVWAGSYLGWLPLAGILPSATEHPASQNAMMITAHVVWGAALSIILEGINKDNEKRH